MVVYGAGQWRSGMGGSPLAWPMPAVVLLLLLLLRLVGARRRGPGGSRTL